MKKAAIYLRVSTTDQNYERQEVELRLLANGFGYEITKVFEEKASGVLDMDTREQLTEMRKLTSDDVDKIFVWDISRLSRKASDFIALVNEFAEKGVCIHFKDKNIITLDDDGKISGVASIYLYMLGVFAQMDAENLKSKFKSGKENALRKGHSYTNNAPFGYDIIDKYLYVNELEAESVKLAFDLFHSGKDTQYIADIFNSKNIPLKSGKTNIIWVKGTIYQMLKNPVYYGKGKLESITKKATATTPAEKSVRYFDVDAIIEKNLFDAVQERFTININSGDKSKAVDPAILRGILKCGQCNKYYVLGNNNGVRVYKDGDIRANINNKVGCKNGSFTITMADNLVWTAIKGIYEYDSFKKKCVDDKEQSKLELIKNETTLTELNKNITDLDNQISKVNTGYAKGFYNDADALEQKHRITTEKDRFNKIITEIQSKIILLNDRINSEFEFDYLKTRELSLEEKKQVCNSLIEVVNVYRYTDYIKLMQVKLKVGLTFNILFNSQYKVNSYCIIDDDDVTFNNIFNAPEEVREILKGKDFTVTSSNNKLFNDEVFGEYSYTDIWEIMKKYNYLKKID
jgi:DNA invertase Pin-like site-specific DNA recombinase